MLLKIVISSSTVSHVRLHVNSMIVTETTVSGHCLEVEAASDDRARMRADGQEDGQ